MLVNFSGSDLQDCKNLVQSSPQNVKLGSFTSWSCKKSETCPKTYRFFVFLVAVVFVVVDYAPYLKL